MSREWRLYFDDMALACDKVLAYTAGRTREAFEQDGLTYDATLWNVQLLGEAARNIPDEIRERMPEIPWRELIGLRNRLVHGYFGLNQTMFWQIVSIEVPNLRETLARISETRTELFAGQA